MDGIIVTKLDGDSRGGAALSMRAITQKPIKFIGMGEKSSELEIFDPKRIANRILGMADIVSLVEKAQEQLDSEKAQRMIERLEKGRFNMNDLKLQLEQTIKMGGMQGMIGMMPGLGKLAKQVENSNIDDRVIKKQISKGIENLDDEQWYSDIELKVMAAVRMSRGVIPYMKNQGSGCIVNATTGAGKVPESSRLPNSVSRAAGINLTKSLAN